MLVDRYYDGDASAHQASTAVVEEWIAAVGSPVRVGFPADHEGEDGVQNEEEELGGQAQTEQQSEGTRRECRSADENQKEARRDDLGDQQQNAADHPQPTGLEIVDHQPSILGTPGTVGGAPRVAVVFGRGGAGGFGPPPPPVI